MAFCTRCGQQTESGQRTAGGAALCLICGALAAGPEVHHGYPGRRTTRHARADDVYGRQNGALAACRVPLSDYPSLTDLPAVAGTWPTTSYATGSRSGRHALPPELTPRPYPTAAAQLAVRPGPPEFEDEQLAAGAFALPYALPAPVPADQSGSEHGTVALNEADPESQSGREGQSEPQRRSGPGQQPARGDGVRRDDVIGSQDDPGLQTHIGPRVRPLPVRAAAHRALTVARGNRRVSAAAAGLVLAVGTATAAIAMADHNPPSSSRGAAGNARLGLVQPSNATVRRDGPGSGPIGLVRATSAAAAAPHEARVLSLLDRYFGAINAHDYAAFQRLLRPALRGALPETRFMARYGTATDSGAILRGVTSIGRQRLDVLVTFTSHRQPGSSAASRSCTDWAVRLYLLREGNHYVMASPPAGYQPYHHSCP